MQVPRTQKNDRLESGPAIPYVVPSGIALLL